MNYSNVKLLIDGKWRNGEDERSLAVHNPATDEELGRVAQAGKSDLDRALIAAEKGFRLWYGFTPAERSKIMRRAAAHLRTHADETSYLLTLEQGKPRAEALAECLSAADIIEWFADEGMRVYGRIVPSRSNPAVRQLVLKDPVGPVAAFTPWNFPLNLTARKVGAALAAGCSIIVKGPEETPAAPAALMRAFTESGMPSGVLGLVFGNPAEISHYLISHPVIRKVTFTGSTQVGKQLASLAGAHMKRVTMELGGHAPVIVCDDADIDLAVSTVGASKFRNAGQVCIAPTRYLVHESIHKQFADAFANYAHRLQVGDGLLADTQMGPLVSERRLAAMVAMTTDAVERGAVLLAGGKRLGDTGNFWQPTILDAVPKEAHIMHDEPFGPVAVIDSFDRLEDAVVEANRLPFGLAGYAFTRSLRNADLLARHMEVGMLWINMAAAPSAEMPFGGLKDSGYGSEGGPEALEAYLNTRAVAIANV